MKGKGKGGFLWLFLILCLPAFAKAEILPDMEACRIFKRKVAYPYEAVLFYDAADRETSVKVGHLTVTKEGDIRMSVYVRDISDPDLMRQAKENTLHCREDMRKNIMKNGSIKLVISGLSHDGKLWDGKLYIPGGTDYFVPGIEVFLKGCGIRAVEKNGKSSVVYVNGADKEISDLSGGPSFSIGEMVNELAEKKEKVKQTASNVVNKALKYDGRVATKEGRAELAEEYGEMIDPVWEDLKEYSDKLAERDLSPVWMSRRLVRYTMKDVGGKVVSPGFAPNPFPGFGLVKSVAGQDTVVRDPITLKPLVTPRGKYMYVKGYRPEMEGMPYDSSTVLQGYFHGVPFGKYSTEFHDVLMNKWGMENPFIKTATIAPTFIVTHYAGLGTMLDFKNYRRNMGRIIKSYNYGIPKDAEIIPYDEEIRKTMKRRP